jgi:hypothetical protein
VGELYRGNLVRIEEVQLFRQVRGTVALL